MRELKFRAWHNNEITHNVSVGPDEDGKYCLMTFAVGGMMGWPHYEITHYPKSEIMQFTGHEDKNGKEIYEGDILKYKYYVDYGQSGELKEATKPIEVRWSHGGFYPITSWDGYAEQLKHCEVIGNIHENPELLK